MQSSSRGQLKPNKRLTVLPYLVVHLILKKKTYINTFLIYTKNWTLTNATKQGGWGGVTAFDKRMYLVSGSLWAKIEQRSQLTFLLTPLSFKDVYTHGSEKVCVDWIAESIT